MNKSDLVDALASAAGMTKADASRAVDAMFSPSDGIIAGALSGGEALDEPPREAVRVHERRAAAARTARVDERGARGPADDIAGPGEGLRRRAPPELEGPMFFLTESQNGFVFISDFVKSFF